MFDVVDRRLLKALGLSESEAARTVGVSPGHLSRVLSGERPASPRLRQALCRLARTRMRTNVEVIRASIGEVRR